MGRPPSSCDLDHFHKLVFISIYDKRDDFDFEIVNF